MGNWKLIWFIEQQWLKWISAGSTFDFKLHHGLPHGISWSWWNSQSAPFLTTEESQVEHLMDESFLTMFCLAISEWNDKWSTNSIYQIFHLPLDWILFLFKKRFSLKCSMEWLNNMCIHVNKLPLLLLGLLWIHHHILPVTSILYIKKTIDSMEKN